MTDDYFEGINKQMIITKHYITALLALLTLTVLAFPCFAALDWDGQTGVFLNALAYTAKPSSVEVATHNVDLGKLGSASTYNVILGFKGNVEVGFTKYVTSVTGIQNQSVEQVKWQFLPETKSRPAVAVWGTNRKLSNGPSASELGLSATKVLHIGKLPLVADVGLRSTTALGMGLFGIGDERKTLFEGTVALFVTKNFAVGTEYKQQIDARAWRDIAFRYVASPSLNVDLGIANFATGLSNQLALAVTYAR